MSIRYSNLTASRASARPFHAVRAVTPRATRASAPATVSPLPHLAAAGATLSLLMGAIAQPPAAKADEIAAPTEIVAPAAATAEAAAFPAAFATQAEAPSVAADSEEAKEELVTEQRAQIEYKLEQEQIARKAELLAK